MKRMKIAKIEVLPSKELAIYPIKPDDEYGAVYREAAGVYWDDEKLYFFAPFIGYDAHEWSYCDWYEHITKVVLSGLGMNLTITRATQWVNVPDDQKNLLCNL